MTQWPKDKLASLKKLIESYPGLRKSFLETLAFDRDGKEQTEYFDRTDQQSLDKAVQEFLETLSANELLTVRRCRHGDFDSFVAPMLKRGCPQVISPNIFSAQPLLTSPPSSHGVIFAEEDKG